MCLFCDCGNAKKWRESVDQKLDAIKSAVDAILTPEQREAIRAATAQLKASAVATNAAILKDSPKGETP